MIISKETRIKIIAFLFVVLFVVPTIHYFGYRNAFASDLYTVVLCGAFAMWGISVAQRVIDKRCRLFLALLAFDLVVFQMIKIVRYQQSVEGTIASRYLWYFYYVPIILMVQLSFFCALCMVRPQTDQPVKKWLWTIIPSTVLAILIVTNDMHKLVFSFPQGLENADSVHTYRLGMFVVYGYLALLIIVSFILVFHRCSLPQNRKYIYIPILVICVCLTLIIAVPAGVNIRINGIQTIMFPDVVCIMPVCVWESLIQIGLFPANSGYEELFRQLDVSAKIVDDRGNVIYTGNRDYDVDESKMNKDGDFMLDDNVRIHKHAIMGGELYYVEDLSRINQLSAAIEEAKEVIAGENALIEEENKLREENARYQKMNAVYDEIANVVHSQTVLVEKLLSVDAKDEMQFRENISKAVFLGAYIKRRSNVILQSKQSAQIPAMELFLALQESVGCLSLLGINGYVTPYKGNQLYSIDVIAGAYDFFEALVEKNYLRMNTIMLALKANEDCLNVRMMIALNEKNTISLDDLPKTSGEISLAQEDDGIVLTLTLKEGGDVACD